YPSSSIKKTTTTEQNLLTNYKPEGHIRRRPSESTTLATPIIIYCSSFAYFSGWLHAIGTQIDRGLAEASVKYVSALICRLCTIPEP
uniref:Ovule protein n=1 Tax=Mesocestoides corti TaxID=53468 RepID=A0A5K3F9L9_MESCO